MKTQTQKRYSFYAVYDGHRGVDAANYCAENLHQILCKTRSFHEGNIEKALRETFIETDRLFCSSLFKTQCGATAIVCLREMITNETNKQVKLYFAWAGDSQAVLVRDGSAIDVTPPHKPDDDKEIARIESLGGAVIKTDCYRVNGILGVARAIGDAGLKPYISAEPDIRVETLVGAEDFLIIGCDGLWDEIDCDYATQLVYETIEESPDAEAAAKTVAARLIEHAKDQGSADNITAIVIFLRSLREIFPSASFNNDPSHMEVVNTKEETTATLFGLEPVQLRAKKDGNIIQGYGEDVEARIAGDSTADASFKNGSVTYPFSTPRCEEKDPLPHQQGEEEIVKPPSPTQPTQSCLAASSISMTETMNLESTSSLPSSIPPSSKLGEEAIPPPHLPPIKSEIESSNSTTTSSSFSSCTVTPPNISGNDLMHFSFTPRPAETSQKSAAEEAFLPDTTTITEEMERDHARVSPLQSSMKYESKSDEIRVEEEYEETTVTTETVFDPIPMTRTTEKIFSAPSDVTNLIHELSTEHRTNGRSPSPTKRDDPSALRESFSLTTPFSNEKMVRVIGELSDLRESPSQNERSPGQRVLDQVKETKVFEVDTVINKSPIPGASVRVHNIVLEAEAAPSTTDKKFENHLLSDKNEVNRTSFSSSGLKMESSMENKMVTTSSEVASSSFQASSNGFNRAFLECDSSQNLSKDDSRMRDFSPNMNGQTMQDVNNDYLTLSGVQNGLSSNFKVLDASHDMDLITSSMKKITTNDINQLANDLKPLPSSPVKRSASPTAASKAKEVQRSKGTVSAPAKPRTSLGAVNPVATTRTSSLRTAISKPSTVTAAAKSSKPAPKSSVATTSGPATVGSSRLATTMAPARRPVTAVSKPFVSKSTQNATSKSPASVTTRPATSLAVKSSVAPRVVTNANGIKATTRPAASVSTRPASSILSRQINSTSALKPSLVTKKPPTLPKVASSTSSLRPETSKVTSLTTSSTTRTTRPLVPRVASLASRSAVSAKTSDAPKSVNFAPRTVRLNVPATSGLKSASTSALRSSVLTRKTEVASKPATRISPTKTTIKTAGGPKEDGENK